MSFFKRIATPLIQRGIPVIPVNPGEKKCTLEKWQDRAQLGPAMIDFWDEENPAYNVGCVAYTTPGGICILDCDVQRLPQRIEAESGHKFEPTLVVKSAGKGCLHVYYRQTARSIAIGNRKVGDLFDFQCNRKYVVGPGSVLAETGKTYTIFQDYEIADFPDWLGDWIESNSRTAKKSAGCKMSPVRDEFDMDDLMDFYSYDWRQMGTWYNFVSECPVAGYQHKSAKLPGFFFDGEDLGWNCWASGCESNGWSAGRVIKALNEKHGTPYPHLIWPDNTMEIVEAGGIGGNFATEAVSNDVSEGAIGGERGNPGKTKTPVKIRLKPRYQALTATGETISSMDGKTWRDSKGRTICVTQQQKR